MRPTLPFQTRYRGAGPFGVADGGQDRGVVRQHLFGCQPVLLGGQEPQCCGFLPVHQPAAADVAIRVALTHAHQGLSVVVHFEFPPAHRPSGKKAAKATDLRL